MSICRKPLSAFRNCALMAAGAFLLVSSVAQAQMPPAGHGEAAKPAAAPGAKPAAPGALKPTPSPAAKVMAQVGTTEITVEYSSPGVKKRKIWGELVPNGKPWRTGANASTKVTFSQDVEVGGKSVPAGTYSLLTIPTPKSWTIILNKNTGIGGNIDEKYKQEEDVARFTVTPSKIPARERLTFIFSDVTDDSASLDLEWEKVRVSLPIKTKKAAS
jgi:hypothetical protein